tara:strand:+ start:2800 stop:2916 length:117 start_codon:yes stop_codon:yes gene_type:complete
MPISKQLKGNRTKKLKQQATTAIAMKKRGIQPKRKQYA